MKKVLFEQYKRLTATRLARAIRHVEKNWPGIYADDYHNCNRFWDDVESAFPEFKMHLCDYLEVSEDELDDFIMNCEKCGDYVPND